MAGLSTKARVPIQVPGSNGTVAGRPNGLDRLDAGRRRAAWPYLVAGTAVAAAFTWAYGGILADLWDVWLRNDNYSSGMLVPIVVGCVLWARRKRLAAIPASPCYWGLLLVAGGFAMRFLGTFLMYGSLERLSLVVVVTGLVLALFGRTVTRRLAGVLAFLLLMLPWPQRLHAAVSLPLQGWATSSAVFLLELFGWLVVREGNVLHVDGATVAVAEACSGLRMLTAFMVVSALVAFQCRRPWWEKAVLILSSVPVALASNAVRLTVTAIAFTWGQGERVNALFHDFGGYAMMPLALGAILGELWLLGRLFAAAPAEREGVPVVNQAGGGPR